MQILIIVVFVAVLAVLAYLSLGIGAAAVGYGLMKAKFGSSPKWTPPAPPQPTGTGWIFQYSARMIAGQTPEDFDFPTQDGVHYCVKQSPAMSLGQTVSINFKIVGAGTLIPAQGNPPALLRLYMQRRGDNMSGTGEYQQYRYWSGAVTLVAGDLSLSARLDPANWTDVYGKPGTDFPNQFAACVANAGVIGFTFGGEAAGHGVYVKDGASHFTLTSYTIT